MSYTLSTLKELQKSNADNSYQKCRVFESLLYSTSQFPFRFCRFGPSLLLSPIALLDYYMKTYNDSITVDGTILNIRCN